jgi:DNA-binding CsgD family transcriptional regulator
MSRRIRPQARRVQFQPHQKQQQRDAQFGKAQLLLGLAHQPQHLRPDNGGKQLDAQVATAIAMHVLDDDLSDREAAVLTLAAGGNSNRQIGARLGLSEETVKGHMKLAFAGGRGRPHPCGDHRGRRGLIDLRPRAIHRRIADRRIASTCQDRAPARLACAAFRIAYRAFRVGARRFVRKYRT